MVVNLLFLYFFTEIFGVWYVISSIIAFLASLLTGFFLQKFWTFRDKDTSRIKRQMFMYAAIGALNLALGPALLYGFVESFHVWYMLAAAIVMGALAVANYLVNKFITFKKDIAHAGFNAQH